jgi:hypothetical protein
MFCDNYPCGHASSDIKQRNLKWFRTLSGLVFGFLLFGSSLRWGNVYIGSAGYKPLNSRGRPSVVAQPFSRVGPYRILVRPHVGALMAASLAGEPRFDIGQPDTGHRSALIAVEWLQRDNQRSRSAHRARAGTSWARAMVPGPEFSLFSRCLNHQWGHRVFPTSRQCFVRPGGDDTKLRRDETVFLLREDVRKRALGINRPSNEGPPRPDDRGRS